MLTKGPCPPRALFRLAKATLTLIPLFGIHEVVFIFATDEQTTGILRYVKVFFTLFLNSFQVRREHSGVLAPRGEHWGPLLQLAAPELGDGDASLLPKPC